MRVELHEVLARCPAPCIDGLVGVADDEQVLVVACEHFHQAILQLIDILELINHDVFEPPLPFLTDVRMLAEDVEREFQEVVVVETEAFLLLVEVTIKENVFFFRRRIILRLELGNGKLDEVFVILRLADAFAHLEHVACLPVRHVAQCQVAFLVNGREHIIDVTVVEHEEVFREADGMTVFLQHGHGEAMKRIDVARIVIACHRVDAAAHLACRLVRERHAEDIAGQDAELLDEIGKAVHERPRLARARTREHAHEALCRFYRLALGVIEPRKHIEWFLIHSFTPPPGASRGRNGAGARSGRARCRSARSRPSRPSLLQNQ